MQDLSSIFENRIKLLTKPQFDIVVKAYIKCKWKINEVVFTDGSHDGGIDIRIVENDKRKRIPIQVTTDKNTYAKLERDFEKIQKLISEHNYSDVFYFFYNGNSAEAKLNDLEDSAISLGFELRIIDAKEIGGIAGDYFEIKSAINSFINIEEKLIFSNLERMQFDLMSSGSGTIELKQRFTRSLIINSLYETAELSTEEIKKIVNTCFDISKDGNFCEKEIANLRTIKSLVPSEKPGNFKLTDKERGKLDALKETLDLEEKSLIQSVKVILVKYKIDSKFKEVIDAILNFYQTNNSKDIDEIIQRIEEKDYEIQAIAELRNCLIILGIAKQQTDLLLKELFSVCNGNTILQRISAGNLFGKLIDNPLLAAYINQQPKPVYLDTPVLLHLICVFYNPYSKYGNIFHQVALDLSTCLNKGDVKVEVFAIKNYISEVAYQIEEAFLLLPFIESGYYKSFGGNSNNVFLSFYKHLEETDNLESHVSSFSDFMTDFGFNFNRNAEKPIENLIEDISYILETNNVNIINTPNYQFEHKTKDIYASLQKEMENIYSTLNLYRSPITLRHDLNMLLYLFDKDNHKIEPTFVTWDNTFFEIRKNYHKTHSMAGFWHLFRPAKLINHLSLLQFKINSKNIPNSVYSILDNDYDFKNKIKTLQGVVYRVIDLSTSSGIKLSKELKTIRENDIYEINSKAPKTEVTLLDSLPIDQIFIKIGTHFLKNGVHSQIVDFKRTINSESSVDEVIHLIKEELIYFKKNKAISDGLFPSFEKLIQSNSIR